MTTESLERKALKKIRHKAHLLGAYNLKQNAAREIADIFWLACAGLEGREKAKALDTFTTLSGIPTDDPGRIL